MPSVTEILDTMDYGPDRKRMATFSTGSRLMSRASAISSNGGFVKAAKHFDVSNPANGQTLARVAQGSAADVDAAVKAARKAFPAWSKLSGHDRAATSMPSPAPSRARAFPLCDGDDGQWQAHPRVPRHRHPLVARHFYHHAGWAELIEDEFPGHQPVGLCGQIIPWNFRSSCWRGRSRRHSPRATRWC